MKHHYTIIIPVIVKQYIWCVHNYYNVTVAEIYTSLPLQNDIGSYKSKLVNEISWELVMFSRLLSVPYNDVIKPVGGWHEYMSNPEQFTTWDINVHLAAPVKHTPLTVIIISSLLR